MAGRARSFGAAAEAYARARPSYPVAAVRWVLPDRAHRVLDLAAGTGKLTTVLLGLGRRVVAVEPDPQMRRYIDPRAQVLAGTAEDIPVDDASVDAVVVGQAWHWFDQSRAAAECRRILRPGGRLGLLWNVLDDRTPWVRAVADLAGLEDRVSNGDITDEPTPLIFSSGTWERLEVPHHRPGGPDLVLDDLRSRSAIILRPPDEQHVVLSLARSIVPTDLAETPFVCIAWRATHVT